MAKPVTRPYVVEYLHGIDWRYAFSFDHECEAVEQARRMTNNAGETTRVTHLIATFRPHE